MKTYEQGKAELDAELRRLRDAIKFAKKSITYDFKCPQCKKTTKQIVNNAKIGVGLKYCGANCRAKAYRQRKEQSIRDGYESEIYLLKQKITELENEKR
jgi:hypothetical protein|tara:strand:+ start:49 stop:345 length:297 start_codon:yes stop_codon:yes gene_type:complete